MVAPRFEFPQTMAEYLAQLEHERAGLIRAANLATAPADQRPSPDRWSVNEVLYHMHLGEKGVCGALAAVISANERNPPKSREELREEWQKVLQVATDRETRINAPAPFLPDGAPTKDDILKLLAESRERLLGIISGLTEDDLASLSRPHPAVGPLSLAGWLTIIALHEHRHARQIDEISAKA